MLNFIKNKQTDIILITGFILISIISFNVGKIVNVKKSKEPTLIRNNLADIFLKENFESEEGSTKNPVSNETEQRQSNINFEVIASKKSTSKKYHYPWCAGAKQIKDENKITFPTAKEAEKAGYTLAGNCQAN